MTIEFIKQLENYIAKNRLEEFTLDCDTIKDCPGLDIKNELLDLAGWLSQFKRREKFGILQNGRHAIIKRKIQEIIYKIKSQEHSIKEFIVNKSDNTYAKLLSTLNIVQVIVEKIRIENQNILANFLTEAENADTIIKKVLSLYHNQKNGVNFTLWISFLKEFKKNAPKNIQKEIVHLQKELKNLQSTLYTYDKIDLSPQRLKKFKKEVKNYLLAPEEIKKFHLTILDKLPPSDAQRLVEEYLNYLRTSENRIASYCTEIKHFIKHEA